MRVGEHLIIVLIGFVGVGRELIGSRVADVADQAFEVEVLIGEVLAEGF